MIRHVLEVGPRHDLQQIPIEWLIGPVTSGRRRAVAIRMQVIQICSGAHDVEEFLKGMPALRPSRSVWSQVTADDVRRSRNERTEIVAAAMAKALPNRFVLTRFLLELTVLGDFRLFGPTEPALCRWNSARLLLPSHDLWITVLDS